jgi:hypothetical protein
VFGAFVLHACTGGATGGTVAGSTLADAGDSAVPPPAAGTASSTSGSAAVPPTDGGGSPPEPDAGGACNDGVAIDETKFPYHPPKVTAGACTNAHVDDLVAFVQTHADATYADLQARVATYPAACASCIVGRADDATWSPLLTTGGQISSRNSSGCVQLASGNSEACGRAHRQWDQCMDQACRTCDAGRWEVCRSDAQGGVCQSAFAKLSAACGDGLSAYRDACTRFDQWIRRQCVQGS